MSGPEETQAYRDAKAFVDSTKRFITDDENFHEHLVQWKFSIQWNDVIHGPFLAISEPFRFLTALAGRIHDDCVVIADGGHVDNYQTRLQDLRSKVQALHEAFKTKGATIEATASAMKSNKDLAFAEEGNIDIKLKAVDQAIEALVREADNRNASVAELEKELGKISSDLQHGLKQVDEARQEFNKETARLGNLRETDRKGLTGMKRFHRTEMLKIAIYESNLSVKSLEAKKLAMEIQLESDKSREATSKATQAKYAAILLDLNATKNNLTLQKNLLETAKGFAHKASCELIDVSDKWYKIVGNIGILNNRLDDIEQKVLADFIPTIVDVSDLVVRAANEGCRFLQYAGVEVELRETLEKIEKANDWNSENDQVKTLKKNLHSVRGLMDTTVQELPQHATDASWFPQPLTLPHGTEEM